PIDHIRHLLLRGPKLPRPRFLVGSKDNPSFKRVFQTVRGESVLRAAQSSQLLTHKGQLVDSEQLLKIRSVDFRFVRQFQLTTFFGIELSRTNVMRLPGLVPSPGCVRRNHNLEISQAAILLENEPAVFDSYAAAMSIVDGQFLDLFDPLRRDNRS